MWLKILTMILSSTLGQASASAGQPGALTSLSRKTIRKALVVLTTVSVAVVLFFAGLLTVVLDLVLTSRDYGGLLLSSVSAVGFSLIGIAVVVIAVSLRRSSWQPTVVEAREEKPSPSPLQEALADLVHDFVSERRMARQMAEEQFSAPAARPTPAFDERVPDPPPIYM